MTPRSESRQRQFYSANRSVINRLVPQKQRAASAHWVGNRLVQHTCQYQTTDCSTRQGTLESYFNECRIRTHPFMSCRMSCRQSLFHFNLFQSIVHNAAAPSSFQMDRLDSPKYGKDGREASCSRRLTFCSLWILVSLTRLLRDKARPTKSFAVMIYYSSSQYTQYMVYVTWEKCVLCSFLFLFGGIIDYRSPQGHCLS
jgi:hypothetical protein